MGTLTRCLRVGTVSSTVYAAFKNGRRDGLVHRPTVNR